MNKAALIHKYGKGKAWERAGLYYLDPPIPQRRKDGGHDHYRYVMVMVQGDTADMYEADANGKLSGPYAKWTPLTRDDGEIRGLFNVVPLTCTGALEAEGYTVVPLGEMTA